MAAAAAAAGIVASSRLLFRPQCEVVSRVDGVRQRARPAAVPSSASSSSLPNCSSPILLDAGAQRSQSRRRRSRHQRLPTSCIAERSAHESPSSSASIQRELHGTHEKTDGQYPLHVSGAPTEEDDTGVVSSNESTEVEWTTIPEVFETCAKRFGSLVATYDPHRGGKQLTYAELWECMRKFAWGLRANGIQRGDTIALFSENSHRWLIADQGIMACGAIDAVRGSKVPADELAYLFGKAECTALVAEDATALEKVTSKLDSTTAVKFAVLLWGDKPDTQPRFPVMSFEELLEAGAAAIANSPNAQLPKGHPRDVATIAYTSGTSGYPKGVALTQANLMHQVSAYRVAINPNSGDALLCLLPSWHMYERSCELFVASRGMRLVYTSVLNFKQDLAAHPPDYFVAVPLVFETLYNNVQKRLATASKVRQRIAALFFAVSAIFVQCKRAAQGLSLPALRRSLQEEAPPAVLENLRFVGACMLALLLWPVHAIGDKLVYSKIRSALGIRKRAICGGGSLPRHVDDFFSTVGITLLNGYGLTETSPVLAVRRDECNVAGTVGPPIPGTQIRVIDAEMRTPLPAGSQGVVQARGPQIMRGYYHDDAATARVIDTDGWFDTGDLGWLTPTSALPLAARHAGGMLVLAGRQKDTIVLSNGENVEPVPLEEAALASPFIKQIMIVGQDKRRLGALIVPDKDEIRSQVGEDVETDKLHQLIKAELESKLGAVIKRTTKERFGGFRIIDEAFSIDSGTLTPTLKMKRSIIAERHSALIESMLK
eukprot:jgi/Chlat1/7230/Chrsp57S06863